MFTIQMYLKPTFPSTFGVLSYAKLNSSVNQISNLCVKWLLSKSLLFFNFASDPFEISLMIIFFYSFWPYSLLLHEIVPELKRLVIHPSFNDKKQLQNTSLQIFKYSTHLFLSYFFIKYFLQTVKVGQTKHKKVYGK